MTEGGATSVRGREAIGGGGGSDLVFTVPTSGTDVRAKEVVLVCLAFLLLFFSSEQVPTFFPLFF